MKTITKKNIAMFAYIILVSLQLTLTVYPKTISSNTGTILVRKRILKIGHVEEPLVASAWGH